MRCALSLLPLLLLGCASTSESEAVDDHCTKQCAAEHKCLAHDEPTCVVKCKAAAPKFRADYLTGASKCLEGVDCSKWDSESARCSNVSKESIAPTQSVRNFCNDSIKKRKDCSTAWYDLAACLEVFKIFSDGALDAAAQACLSKPCADYANCQVAELGR